MADHPLLAASYDRLLASAEAGALGLLRGRLLAGARGRVLDVGAGTGANLAHYRPEQVEIVVAAEPDRHMRRRLDRKAAGSPLVVEVHDGGLPELPFADGSFDTVVCTLVLCTVADVPASLAELRRLLRPDGRLLFLEHVRVAGAAGRLQRLAAPAWARLAGGCRIDRDTVGALRAGGFVVADLERPALRRPDRRGRGEGWLITGNALLRQEVIPVG